MDRQLPRDIIRLPPRRLERHQQARARLRPDPVELALRGVLRPLRRSPARSAAPPGADCAPGGRRIDIEQPDIGERVERRIDRIGQAALLADLPGTAATRRRRRRCRRTAAPRNSRGVADGGRWKGERQMRLLARLRGRALTPPVKRAGVGIGAARRRACPRNACSASVDQLRHGRPCRPPTRIRLPVAILLGPPRLRDRSTVIRAMLSSSPRIERPIGWSPNAALHRSSKMMSPGVSRGFAQLLQHDVFLALQLGRGEVRTQDQVGDQLDRERHMLGHDARGEAGAVALGAGVQFAADILDRLADLARRAASGALEHHMLEQMGDAVELGRLVARSAVGEEPDRGGCEPGIARLATRKPVGEASSGASWRRALSAACAPPARKSTARSRRTGTIAPRRPGGCWGWLSSDGGALGCRPGGGGRGDQPHPRSRCRAR